MGVWIETRMQDFSVAMAQVTPFVGVWIETVVEDGEVAAHVKSHPSWVCGLKLNIIHTVLSNLQSHPSWVCGLKQDI